MHRTLSALVCALALADASQKLPQWVRRDGTYGNSTNMNSTVSTISAPTTSILILSTAPTTPLSISIAPVTTSIYSSNYTFFQNTSASTTTSQPSCVGSVTYLDSVPPTVYATITESFLVTVSASNASLPPAITITPPVACAATIIPAALTPDAASSSDPACVVGVCWPGSAASSTAGLTFQPALTVVTVPFSPKASLESNTAALGSASTFAPGIVSTEAPAATEPPAPASTGSAFTSTVLVTKKTPVPVIVPLTSNPPVFQIPSTTKKPSTTTTPKANVGGGSASPSSDVGTSEPPPVVSTSKPPPVVSTSNPPPVVSTSKPPPVISISKTPPPAGQSPTTTPVGNIINSIINNPFTPISSNAGKAPASATIDNVPVEVLPSSVVIGGQVISIPGTSSKTTLQVNGQTFTVQNSQIIAPGTTYAITAARNQESSAAAAPSPVTAGGLTFSVGASQAVISGTTYAIGNGAGSSTTVRVGTQTVVIGSSGVILPSTTVAPAKFTAAPLAPEVVTAAGLTFTVGPTVAIISGSTYIIGPGASSTSVVFGGKTISIGSKGIGLASTTIAPEPNFSVLTVGALTFSVDSTEAILKGTTYKIGKGASTETTVVGGKTISLGPSGVGLQSTTIPPETAPTATGVLQGEAGLFSMSKLCAVSALLVGFGAVFL